ncbi:MAG TPA: hypothetical protein PKD64_04315 [Pirellulaceae bacterium]|mgnify:CR=1 FL=1|nr:hypothetical protein [Pirellulaceae bacterium]HMO91397.1 hypothetical protein [Pirellulaceae bacterium]HMP69622.1 hypothetical protein [Pirellulaceae bacterium]
MATEIPDFDLLAHAAHPETFSAGTIEHLDRLWRELFALNSWHFLAEPKTIFNALDGVKPYPWDRRQNGEKWLLAFTDLARAERWLDDAEIKQDDRSDYFITWTPAAARSYFRTLTGSPVVGVRFNEGSAFGWAAPVEDIERIYNHLAAQTDSRTVT